MRLQTRAVHALPQADPAWGGTIPPVYLSASFAYEDPETLARVFQGREPGFIYSRIGNPTVALFEQAFTRIVEARGAVATSSGMAAITAVTFALARAGDAVAVSSSLFGGTLSLFARLVARCGIEVRLFDPLLPDQLESVLDDAVRFVFLEVIGNPRLDVPDIPLLANLAHAKGIPLVADCTLAPPGMFDPRRWGVDVAVHSLTKYITGNGTVVGGLVVDTGVFDWVAFPGSAVQEAVGKAGEAAFLYVLRREIVQDMGMSPSPIHALFHYLGLETLGLRVRQHCENAQALASFLARHPRVRAVRYPGLEDDPSYPVASRLFEGGRYGGLLTFSLSDREECFRLIRALRLPRTLANLGDAATLIIHPASTIYHDRTEEERAGAGVHEGLLRVSVGIEESVDLMEDFSRALEVLSKE
ncbi:aminotransferase class V-fold PLP-dependent enzyme [Spirochaeta thermophila]|uniref:O-acetylhomoserineaminocarboxypropyltransferase n=1 Tax=Winmispira thermophila (strain ATCC 49972 / DSM 6192 / RI 19.B1) TaxID=665571 RepID=E0RN97_WINT6|nr:aminotransferase class V-fold PLP-dependent enzyme [Spirochaeta thermophila]ADN02566.1 O-acetylhomoserineaminocarboxypropyltransferase [Spirochaeta thermophila DSM 6192]